MSVTTKDIFGVAFDEQPAVADTYGERPTGWRLPDATCLGRVQLQVADLERSLAFYQGDSLLNAGANLAASGHPVDHGSAGEIVTDDPWGTTVRLRAPDRDPSN